MGMGPQIWDEMTWLSALGHHQDTLPAWEMSAQQDLAPLEPPPHHQGEAAHEKMRRPSLLQEVELGLSVCLVRTAVPLNPTTHLESRETAL